jgi:alkylglycerol monooxygenase
VIALAASLVGDVLLLPGGSLTGGLVAFAGAQLAYGASFALRDPSLPAVIAGIAVGAIVGATVGRRILAGAPRELRPAVAGYLVVILGMAGLATGSLAVAAVAGAWLFVASDTMLGWSLFVAPADAERPRRRVVVMVTYHLGQMLLVASIAV